MGLERVRDVLLEERDRLEHDLDTVRNLLDSIESNGDAIVERVEEEEAVCPECGFEAKNDWGLTIHQRKRGHGQS